MHTYYVPDNEAGSSHTFSLAPTARRWRAQEGREREMLRAMHRHRGEEAIPRLLPRPSPHQSRPPSVQKCPTISGGQDREPPLPGCMGTVQRWWLRVVTSLQRCLLAGEGCRERVLRCSLDSALTAMPDPLPEPHRVPDPNAGGAKATRYYCC